MRKFFHLTLLAGILLAGCGTLAPASSAQQFAWVTAAPNASPTSTPFQPVPWTPTGTLQPTPIPATPTLTLPAPTETPIPTIDPNLLINTVVPFSTIDASSG